MMTLSNGLSFVRAPLAFLFCQENATLRFVAIFLAMLTDCVDGYLARRNKSVSRFGAILDPAMDKFFVYFALAIFFTEGRLSGLEALAMLSRDFFLCLFGLLMLALGRWKMIVFRAIRWGKATTALQFLVLMSLTAGFTLPGYFYLFFVAMGGLAFMELFQPSNRASTA